MSTTRRFYGLSIVVAVICLLLGGWYGWVLTGSVGGTSELLWIIAVLSVLEISLSFDNAVVNATVLRDMDPIWQRRFLTWGMLIAVFGMRIAFPLAIVAIAAGIGPIEAVRLSLDQPERYEAIVSSAHIGIAGFGGAFLCLVGARFFFDRGKETHWIKTVERRMASFGRIPAIEVALLLLGMFGISTMLPRSDALQFLIAGIFGIVSYVAVEAINAWLEHRESRQRALGKAVKSGLGAFLYLQVLDSSFSFDGVIGAFALSNNMIVIALGLTIGAMFVRSMTIHLVHRGTLSEYRYLENGAFWAIIALGIIMLLSARYDIPEAATGLLGGILIGLSLLWSIRFNRRERAES